MYNNDELIEYLSSLEQAAQTCNYTDPIALALSSSDHTISIGYDPRDRIWYFIDADAKRLSVGYYFDKNALAGSVLHALSDQDRTTFSTDIYFTNNNKDNIDAVVNHWKTNAVMQRMHTVDDIKGNFRDYNGSSWLWIVAYNGQLDVVQELLEHHDKIDFNLPDHDGWTPLIAAVNFGHIDIVKELIRKGADLNLPSNDGWTPLHTAAAIGHLAIVQALLEHPDIDIHLANHNGETPLDMARGGGYAEIEQALLNHGVQASKQTEPVESGDQNIIDMISKAIERLTAFKEAEYERAIHKKSRQTILSQFGSDYEMKWILAGQLIDRFHRLEADPEKYSEKYSEILSEMQREVARGASKRKQRKDPFLKLIKELQREVAPREASELRNSRSRSQP